MATPIHCKCKHINDPWRCYCGACGTKLEPACGKCGFVNMKVDSFCGGCGSPIARITAKAIPAIPHLIAAPKRGQPPAPPKKTVPIETMHDAIVSETRG